MQETAATRVRFEEHVGELRVTIEAPTLEALFAEAARVVSRESGAVQGAPGDWLDVRVEARDDATLLVDWLNELIGISEVEQRAFDDVQVLELGGGRLHARVRGRPISTWTSALKAATYHGLRLDGVGAGWRAQVLLDV